jgi:hypothetical protein
LAQSLLIERHRLPGLAGIGELIGVFAEELGTARRIALDGTTEEGCGLRIAVPPG